MISFELAEPTTLRDAVSLLDAGDPSIRPLAGGTALMLMMKAGVFQPSRLISLGKIEDGFSKISVGRDGELRIGSMTSLSAIEHSSDVARDFPVITRTLGTLSNVRVRNVARIGGALAHGDPHMDLPPVLSALAARSLRGRPSWIERGRRRRALYRLLRNDFGAERANCGGDRAIAKRSTGSLSQVHHPIGRRLAGARRRGVAAYRWSDNPRCLGRHQRSHREGNPSAGNPTSFEQCRKRQPDATQSRRGGGRRGVPCRRRAWFRRL